MSKKIAAAATTETRNKRTKEALIGHLAVDNVTVQGPDEAVPLRSKGSSQHRSPIRTRDAAGPTTPAQVSKRFMRSFVTR